MVTPHGPWRNYRSNMQNILSDSQNPSIKLVSFAKNGKKHRQVRLKSQSLGRPKRRFTMIKHDKKNRVMDPIEFTVNMYPSGRLLAKLNHLYLGEGKYPRDPAFGAVINGLKGISNQVELIDQSYNRRTGLPMYATNRNVYPGFKPLPSQISRIQRNIKNIENMRSSGLTNEQIANRRESNGLGFAVSMPRVWRRDPTVKVG